VHRVAAVANGLAHDDSTQVHEQGVHCRCADTTACRQTTDDQRIDPHIGQLCPESSPVQRTRIALDERLALVKRQRGMQFRERRSRSQQLQCRNLSDVRSVVAHLFVQLPGEEHGHLPRPRCIEQPQAAGQNVFDVGVHR